MRLTFGGSLTPVGLAFMLKDSLYGVYWVVWGAPPLEVWGCEGVRV